MLQVNHLLVAPSRITIRGLVGIQNPDTSDGVRVDAFTSGSPFTTLAEGCSAEANTTVVVSAIEGSIVPGEFLRIDEELLLVRAVHADNHTLEVLRAQGDTAAAVHEAPRSGHEGAPRIRHAAPHGACARNGLELVAEARRVGSRDPRLLRRVRDRGGRRRRLPHHGGQLRARDRVLRR